MGIRVRFSTISCFRLSVVVAECVPADTGDSLYATPGMGGTNICREIVADVAVVATVPVA